MAMLPVLPVACTTSDHSVADVALFEPHKRAIGADRRCRRRVAARLLPPSARFAPRWIGDHADRHLLGRYDRSLLPRVRREDHRLVP